MKNKLIIFLFLASVTASGQISDNAKYVVISFEKKVNKYSQHGIQNFYWIVQIDSVKDKNFKLEPLFFRFSTNDFRDCLKGEKINPFVITDSTNFDFEKDYILSKKNLSQIIEQKKIWVQTITKKWSENLIEEIKVFVTPIIGRFCTCEFMPENQNDRVYSGHIKIPYSSFAFDAGLFGLKNFRFIKFSDYAHMNFDVRYPN
ncbi:MAG: hypothetical protein JST75_21570 [Bacteroidetes bacterium]|nr:hypothetical protein [Bacteroidota bacterium]